VQRLGSVAATNCQYRSTRNDAYCQQTAADVAIRLALVRHVQPLFLTYIYAKKFFLN